MRSITFALTRLNKQTSHCTIIKDTDGNFRGYFMKSQRVLLGRPSFSHYRNWGEGERGGGGEAGNYDFGRVISHV